MTATALMTLAFYVLVVEVLTVVLLILPIISPAMWSRFFSSSFVKMLQSYGRVPFFVSLLFMSVIFYDAARVERESREAKSKVGLESSHHNIEHLNSRLFRAQRDLYIAGFGLFLVFVIYRLCKMVSEVARLDASCTAALRQAESASRAARQMVSDSSSGDDKEKASLKAEIEKKNKELGSLRADLDAMRKQSQGLSQEYDRLADEHSKASKVAGSDKKSD